MSVLSFFGGKPANKSPKSTAASSAPAPAAEPDEKESLERETSIVLDALGTLLQHYGKYAFDTDSRTGDETRRLTHGWMLHATMGAPRPGAPDDRPSDGVF